MQISVVKELVLDALGQGPLTMHSLIYGGLPMMAGDHRTILAVTALEQEGKIQKVGKHWQLCPPIAKSSPDSEADGESVD